MIIYNIKQPELPSIPKSIIYVIDVPYFINGIPADVSMVLLLPAFSFCIFS